MSYQNPSQASDNISFINLIADTWPSIHQAIKYNNGDKTKNNGNIVSLLIKCLIKYPFYNGHFLYHYLDLYR